MNAGQAGGRGGSGGTGAAYGLGGAGGGGGSGGDSGSVSGDNHASEMPNSLCGTNGLDVAMAVLKGPVSYLDYDADTGTFTNAVRECTLVTSETRVLGNGWYAVQGTVTLPEGANLTVSGSAHLILCDGAKLTIPEAAENSAGVTVTGNASLILYGQVDGTGALMANGGWEGAGIGGDGWGKCGTVTINGGMVTATGGKWCAGIGCGGFAAGGTVTINGGKVTTHSDLSGWGICVGGFAAGGTVTINGGAINASSMDDPIAISGGIFARPIKIEWIAEGYAIGGNSDSATSADYPYAVMPAALTVTIRDHPHSTVQWTYGDGSVTSLVSGTSFKLGTGMTGVRVIFTPEHGYRFVEDGETGVRTLPSPVIEDCAVRHRR